MKRCDGLTKRRWSKADDERLELLWGQYSLKKTAEKLGRTEATTYWRARRLRLPLGVPQGHEYLSTAAVRTGFTTAQLRMVLSFAEVRVRRTISRPPERRRGYHFVDPFDVDEAIVLWHSTETVEAGADRLGMVGDTLRRLVIAAGHKPPPRRMRWRVASVELDRIAAEWRAQREMLSVLAHARRVGLHHTTLAKRLRAAGILGEKHPGSGGLTRLSVEAVDAVLRAA